ncbi:MAG: tRNA 4-thiouridine(8) synthase ThiI, partial [Candidatus Cloacimonetes bacterium]|nr:tRNA 4-thiouridine(8) synthase ThiI [Candidatus Cloacimonadota bacterium]
MNPCIDCHGLMFKEAASLMKEHNIDFIISGEVVGQRPMSQRRDALNAVGKLSGIKDLLVRPLSQKLLQDTLPIREGWVKKEDMLDIQGRGRHRQMQMAREFGITYYQTPGGGCLLTDEAFSRRLKDLIEHDMLTINFIEFLKVGRHFRINDHLKVIIGRNDNENNNISKLAGDEIILQTCEIPGPIGAINSQKKPDKKEIKTAASILLRYNNKVKDSAEVLYGKNLNLNNSIKVEKMLAYKVKKLQL